MTTRTVGRATPAGTSAFRARHGRASEKGYRTYRDLWLSTIGLGTYLGEADDATDALYLGAAKRALELGINVLDSAINYRHQRSERVIGAALRESLSRGVAKREEIFVTTKGGFLGFDGVRPRDPRAYVEEHYVRPGVFTWDDLVAGCHCMTPRYLAGELERSRANLGLDTIDAYYVHNPETQLGDIDRADFLGRIRAAFETLEGACAEGKIALYGTATWNGYRQPATAEDHLPLLGLLGVAREVGGPDHHFRVLQLPLNLAMPEAFAAHNQGGKSLLDVAREAGMLVMTSGSILQGRLARLPAELREALMAPGLATDAQRALSLVRSVPGVTTALVGAKQSAHIEENARLLELAPLAEELVRRVLLSSA
jgi:aryl-alcohol dehydrogenase-like predicted oxidoreductase